MIDMSPSLLEEAKIITNELYHSPACSLFQTPVDPEIDRMPDYFDVIKNPQDLGTIMQRLYNNYYTRFDIWVRDVKLVWSNAVKYNGKESIVGMIATAMEKRFKKMVDEVKPYSRNEWIAKVTSLYGKFNSQMESAPESLKQFVVPCKHGPVQEAEMKRFCEASSILTGQNDVLQMMQILSHFGVNVDAKQENPQIDIKNIPDSATRALIGYARKRFRSMRIPYPE